MGRHGSWFPVGYRHSGCLDASDRRDRCISDRSIGACQELSFLSMLYILIEAIPPRADPGLACLIFSFLRRSPFWTMWCVPQKAEHVHRAGFNRRWTSRIGVG